MNRRERRASASAARRGQPPANAPASVGGPAFVQRRQPQSQPPLPSAAELLQRAVSSDARGVVARVLAEGPSADRLHELVDRAADVGAAYMERSPTNPSLLACKKGCSTCCSRPVVATAPSVLRLATWLRARLRPEQLGELLRRVAAIDDVTHGKTMTPKERPPTPCALLVDGACSAYEVRPFVCRAWNAVDAEDCKRALSKDGLEMRFDLYQRTTYASVEQGVKSALSDAGLDGADLELMAALRVALEREDASRAWLAGEPVFAGCEAKLPEATRRRLPVAW